MSVDRTSKLIAIIDDDEAMQESLRDLMEAAGLVAQCFGSAEEFLASDLYTRATNRNRPDSGVVRLCAAGRAP
jgi:FixJ family two-component response regulator